MPGFTHKQWLVRVGTMSILQNVLQTFGSDSVPLVKILPMVCKLVADPNSQVGDIKYIGTVNMHTLCTFTNIQCNSTVFL